MKKIVVCVTLLISLFGISAAAQEPCQHDFRPVEVPASCSEPGYSGLVCSICFQTKDYVSIPSLGHDWSDWVIIQMPDCKTQGLQRRTCLRCAEIREEILAKTPHDYAIWVQKPTCSLNGYTLHTCVICGHEERTDRVESLGHDLQVLVVEPECTKDGYTKYQCTRCTYNRKENLVEKTGHMYDSGTIVKEPGLYATGKLQYTCLNCGEIKTDIIPVWDHPFVDVEQVAYYRDGITWAYHTGITTGTDETHFSPDDICTRAQVVTFLWRWAGTPEPKDMNAAFSDVKAGSFYEKAVAWALEKGITKGVDASHFAPDAVCTRGQVVTLLYRFQGCPVVKGEMPFTDVPSEKFYAMSVLWAYKNKITTGITNTEFDPEGLCTRGQIVTFLFRASDT